MRKNEKGMGLINIVLSIALAGFLIVIGLQLGLGYMDRNIIQKTLATVLVENKNKNKQASISSIKKTIIDRVSINNIDLNNDDITITNNDSEYTIEVNYIKTIKINSDISIVMDFLIEESTP